MLYVYAIVAGTGVVGDLPGDGILPGTLVDCIPRNGLTAIVSEVCVETFGETPLRALLEDSAWTRERALAHERVVAALMPRHTLLPLKFCTLFSAPTSLIHVMERHRGALEMALAHIQGAREWGVKMFYDPSRLRQWISMATRDEEEEPGPAGAAFFARKQREQRLRQEMEMAVSLCVKDSHHRVALLARAATAVAPQSPALHGRRDEMALNGAYLVVDGGEPELRDCLRDLMKAYSPRGFDFVLTGPWAPYNFTRLHLGELLQSK